MAVTADVLQAIGLTVLMVCMVISGFALLLKLIPGVYEAATMYSLTANRVLRFLTIFATIAFVPGTVILYAAYIRKLKKD
ncbi:IMV protein VP13 [Eastern grey kangaroopox virus]|uniref:IMV protein VP13 n=1 Tax=Eastern grey kangaroopox virus TaxID=2042482 RepID=A0A2C9DT21_9POXV|nr:IMV protein VP13 [Eastern grey kangaroopox virus]ATI21154.1 IMV protein VP13 [Eastern grey kangaroopox virus]ATX75062.1 IMV protein VP13 [Eastern grey kangaroopox virus]